MFSLGTGDVYKRQKSLMRSYSLKASLITITKIQNQTNLILLLVTSEFSLYASSLFSSFTLCVCVSLALYTGSLPYFIYYSFLLYKVNIHTKDVCIIIRYRSSLATRGDIIFCLLLVVVRQINLFNSVRTLCIRCLVNTRDELHATEIFSGLDGTYLIYTKSNVEKNQNGTYTVFISSTSIYSNAIIVSACY